jgi:hypothetical protein
MLTIQTINYDEQGCVAIDLIDGGTSFFETARRRSRVKTLDGGTVTEDRGFSVQDYRFSLYFNASRDEYLNIKRIVETNSNVIICCESGVFLCSIEKLTGDNGKFTLTCDVETKYE